MFSLICLIGAFICFALGAFVSPPPGRPNLTNLGLALLTLSFILTGMKK